MIGGNGHYRCYLEEEVLSLNKFVGGVHWASAHKHWKHTKVVWVPLLRSSIGLGFPVPHNDRKRVVRIERWIGKGQRSFDDENMAGGSVKCINDALIELGWIKDDSPKWRTLELAQRKFTELDPSEQKLWEVRAVRTMIEVREVDDG